MANFRSKEHLLLCRDQMCYLQFPQCTNHDTAAAHSNLLRHGRGFSFKSHDFYTVPACAQCHRELDHGKNLTKQEREDAFVRAWEAWQLTCWERGYFLLSKKG